MPAMALNLKDPEVERLAAEIAALTGETKTRAVRRALEERRERLSFQVVRRDRRAEWKRFLECEVWAAVPRSVRGRRVSRRERERLLGYGPKGV